MERNDNLILFKMVSGSMKIGYYLLYGSALLSVIIFFTLFNDRTMEDIIVTSIVIIIALILPAFVLQMIGKYMWPKGTPM